ncbi:MAG: hypothetical protein GX495_00945 [Chloroflexi bacterium]|jgi:cell division protein FtsL|nr:hypothetical protein [Chloroflexota bacterium]
MDRVQSLTQAYSQAPWRKQLQMMGLFLLVVVFAAIVAGIYLSVTARAAEIGRQIQSLQSKIEDVEQTNSDLMSQLAFITSAEQMRSRALSMGFRPIELAEPVFLPVPEYVERQPVILAPAPAPVVPSTPPLPAEYTESLFVWLQRQIDRSTFLFFEVQE